MVCLAARSGAVLASLCFAGAAGAATQTIVYNDFSSVAGLQLNGNAVQNGNELQLTAATAWQSGSVFSTDTVTLNDTSSFSTAFAFVIRDRGGLGNGADGLTFTVQTQSNSVGGSGGGIGYEGIANSVTVEFDTYDNGEPGGSNHVAISLNGQPYSPVATTGPLAPDFDNGETWYAWVDYNGATQGLEVRWSSASLRPTDAGLSYTGNLGTTLGSANVYAGFTSGTGAGWGQHSLQSWTFVNDYEPIPSVPEPSTWLLLLAGIGGVAAAARRRSA